MSDLVIKKAETVILSVDEWFTHAPPKRGARQWKDGRSAKELARACCIEPGTRVPAELEQLFEPLIGVIERADACPEARVPVDIWEGEAPNIDLALQLRGSSGAVSVAVEAKADESFGPRVASVLAAAVERLAADERTNAVARVQGLAAALLPQWTDGMPHLGELRYQLLTGVASALSLAREHKTPSAAFVVFEFIDRNQTSRTKRRRNRDDLDNFVTRLTGGHTTHLSQGELVGPMRVRGNNLIPGSIDLYLGKVRREL